MGRRAAETAGPLRLQEPAAPKLSVTNQGSRIRMKVTGPGGISQTTTGGGARAAAPGFSVETSETTETQAASRLSAPGAVASVDALLALQEAEGPMER